MASSSPEHRHTNRLAKETSPYLLQHAHNPVDWFPWGQEAFEKARAEDRPIFLSVGYSTCYWCHVMERQSFENEAVAAEMNARFVNIKVDREERPDVDQLYMTAVQVLEGHGGWPMSVWLTPDLRPFHGGTYFPPTDAHGRPGFVTLIKAIEDAYRNRRPEVDRAATRLKEILEQLAEPQRPERAVRIDDAFVTELVRRSTDDYEARYGGFGSAPKFPRETLLELLLAYLSGSEISDFKSRISKMLRHALDAMADGGIRDHLGGGFHRYSTDAKWLVPHFEIMLYDNAMLGYVYAGASQQFSERRYGEVARRVFEFVLREMTSPQGAFYTALDAEVDAQEGLSYLWTAEEVRQLLGDDSALFENVYGLDRGPNFADPHHGTGRPDKNILYLPEPMAFAAQRAGISEEQLEARLEPMRQTLYAARRQRKQPLLDTKIITSWNALMVRALAFGGVALDEPRYTKAAAKAADFLLKNHLRADGTLWRTSRDGVMKHDAFLDDYAFLAQALLELHTATGEAHWLDHAGGVTATMSRLFGDDQRGGFYFTAEGARDLIVRQKVAQDSPLPSGNAVAAIALMQLNRPEPARRVLEAFARQLERQGEASSSLMQAALLYVRKHGPLEVAASGQRQAERPKSPQELAASVISIEGQWRSSRELRLEVQIVLPYHLNAHQASAGMVGTELAVTGDAADDVEQVEYPPGRERRFEFSEAPLAVYEGKAEFVVRFKTDMENRGTIRLAMTYQACDESACLAPVTVGFEVVTPDDYLAT